MLLLKAVVFSLFLRLSFSQATYSYTSTPSRLPGRDAVYLVATVGQSQSISCNITNDQTGDIVPPVWSLSTINGSQFDLSFNDTNGLSEDPSLSLMVSGDDTNLTVLAFTEDYNRATFSCGPMSGVVLERFVIGILNPPTLIGDISTVSVTEGESKTITLISQSSNPFPPFYTLGYNGDINSFILTNTSLWISNAQRNMSGNYTFFLNHASGNLSVTFTLNVQYAPSGIPDDTAAYGRIGDNITLTLFSNLSGNPFPRVEWYFDGAILSDTSKYDLSHPLKLIIMNVDSEDFGSYTGYAINIAGNISSVITLTEAVQPGTPLSLQESNVTHNSVYIKWMEPADTGLPQLSGYIVMISLPVQGSPFITADTSISINGLLPTTQYSVSVAAVSLAYPEGGNETSLSFTTTDGPPEFSTTAITPLPNANISIALKLRHTGGAGYDAVSIDAYCSTDMDYDLGSGSGDHNMNDANTFIYSCEERCFDEQFLRASFSLGPITAGRQYYCFVNAYNLVGGATLRQNLVPVIGKPSRPVVAVSTSPGLISASLLCQYAGILAGTSLSFNMTVETDQGNELYTQTYEYTDYTNNTNRSVSIPVNGGMMYYVEVFAINEHGYSELTRLGPFNVTVNVTEAPTEEESTRLLIIIIGASVGGLIVAVVFISIIICICGCCCKKRKSRTVQFHTTSAQTWKRSDSRAMEMSQRYRR